MAGGTFSLLQLTKHRHPNIPSTEQRRYHRNVTFMIHRRASISLSLVMLLHCLLKTWVGEEALKIFYFRQQ
jgi:hypothetical protein